MYLSRIAYVLIRDMYMKNKQISFHNINNLVRDITNCIRDIVVFMTMTHVRNIDTITNNFPQLMIGSYVHIKFRISNMCISSSNFMISWI